MSAPSVESETMKQCKLTIVVMKSGSEWLSPANTCLECLWYQFMLLHNNSHRQKIRVVNRETRVMNEAYAKRASPKSLSRLMTDIEVMELVSSYHLRLSQGDTHGEAIQHILANQFRGATAVEKYIREYKGLSAEAISRKFKEGSHRVQCKSCQAKTYIQGSKIPPSVINDLKPLLEESYRSHKTNFPWMFSSRIVQRLLNAKGYKYSLRACQDIVKYRMEITRKRAQELQNENQRESWNDDLMAKFYVLYILLIELCNASRGGYIKLLGGDGSGESPEAYIAEEQLNDLIPGVRASSSIRRCQDADTRYTAR